MIQVGTRLKVLDNSGGKIAQCIRVVQKRYAKVGDIILVSLQKVLPHQRVLKGDKRRAIVLQTKSPLCRSDGSTIRTPEIGVVLLNDKGLPIGTRINAAFCSEMRRLSPKIWSLNKGKVY